MTVDFIVTPITAAFITALYVLLSLRVINLRRSGVGPSVGQSGEERFVRAVRAHANLGEYAPLFLILLLISEMQGFATQIVALIAFVFCVGRIVHAVGIGYVGTGPWRTLGMVCTNAGLLCLAGWLFFQAMVSL